MAQRGEGMANAASDEHGVHRIGVRPFAGGWAVSDDSFDNPQVFRSGSRAEDAAKSLGARSADAGYASEITIFLRNGAIGGRFICRADGA